MLRTKGVDVFKTLKTASARVTGTWQLLNKHVMTEVEQMGHCVTHEVLVGISHHSEIFFSFNSPNQTLHAKHFQIVFEVFLLFVTVHSLCCEVLPLI